MDSNHQNMKNARKEKTRNLIKNADSSRITVIPAIKQVEFHQDKSWKRVAVYARVSTDSEKQVYSLEMQQKYYSEFIHRHEGWELVGIYADEQMTYGQKPKIPSSA